MKLTKTTLKQIIKEELSKALNEVTEMQPAVQLTDEMNAALSRGEVNEDELMMAVKYNLPWKSQENRQTLNFLNSFEQDLDQYASAGKHGTARQAINKARKDGLIDKNTWRKLRRKHHRARPKRPSRKELEYPDQGGGKLAAGGVKKAREQGRTAVVMSDKNKLEVAGIKELDKKISMAFRYINDAAE